MCRHLAYLGEPVSLGRVLSDPEHSLVRQSWEPRRQRSGTVNADGFGVGWYAEEDPVPARYRRAGPIWGDLTFSDLARVVRSGAVLAAVRDATRPGADGEAAAAPFAEGHWLFSHNGSLRDWPDAAAPVAARLPPQELLSLAARTDSALIWALVLHRLRADPDLGAALAGTVRELAEAAPGSRLNLLLTDGRAIAATAWGDSLWYLADTAAQRTVVASEPYDDDARWCEVPDGTLLTATRTRIDLVSLKEPPTGPSPSRHAHHSLHAPHAHHAPHAPQQGDEGK
ncbi:ergothioneine biosynthesis protein EgtC [Streptomyces sp. G1]|uniref:ergothioneine biosynthesis protein EgtC n=1 Tax=Streptomyces sp. G1 TaxID=361572 RepID=UPI002030C63E|nr:ergothioneine biosynthesis protein EgtC [Streptomyces sp. G1]MCM1968139.1 ergothioneine biosynthesis protein EgtC [Streptomyces sp. G1]